MKVGCINGNSSKKKVEEAVDVHRLSVYTLISLTSAYKLPAPDDQYGPLQSIGPVEVWHSKYCDCHSTNPFILDSCAESAVKECVCFDYYRNALALVTHTAIAM